MADLFHKQAEKYAETRPSYPSELFQFIAAKTPRHDLVWDVGTGSGQAAVALAKIYKNVVGTDTSQQQLSYGPKLSNVRYVHTAPTIALPDLHANVAPPDSVDLITVAQAFHWFDLPSFYEQVRSVLHKPNGVLAVWCYVEPVVDPTVDEVFWHLYNESQPYWAEARKIVDDRYRNLDFPFHPVDGEESTGPFEFAAEIRMNLNTFLTYIKSWSAYQTAMEKGMYLLPDQTVENFRKAWGGDAEEIKVVKFPIFLRIGKVGA
ncbi:hypothetical protein LUZ60_004026 [Juncus effusus]|nr:hypothetical protein LUZ60_004026 [Juncus effusus]